MNVYDVKYPLLEAIEKGFNQIVQILLNDKNIDVNIIGGPENQPYCALSYACRNERKEIISLLLQHPKIDVNLIIRKGREYTVNFLFIILHWFQHVIV